MTMASLILFFKMSVKNLMEYLFFYQGTAGEIDLFNRGNGHIDSI